MRLKELRIASGTTQKDVAESIGCTATVYSRYEREEREPDIQTLCRLASYFQVSIDYLVENNPKKQLSLKLQSTVHSKRSNIAKSFRKELKSI